MQGRIDRDIRNAIAAGVFLLAGLLCVLPVAAMLGGAFWQDGRLSFSAARAVLTDWHRLATLLRNSALVTGVTVAVALLAGLPLGFLCARTDMPLRNAIIFCCIPAACVPLYVAAAGWMAAFNVAPGSGRIIAAGLMQGAAYVPLAVLMSALCFASADPDLEDAASLDAGRAGVLARVSLPQAAWGIFATAAVVALLALGDMTVTDTLAIRTFAEEVYSQFQFSPEPRQAAVVSLPLTVLLAALGLWLWRALAPLGEASAEAAGAEPRVIRLGRGRYPASVLSVIFLAVLFGRPLVAIAAALGSVGGLLTAARVAGGELWMSIWTAAVAAAVCGALAPSWAWAILRTRRLRWAAAGATVLLLCVPAPVVGIGLIRLLNRPGLAGSIYDTPATVVMACVVRALPFAVLAMIPALRRIPAAMEEAGTLDGAGWFARLRHLIFPLAWRGVVSAFFLAFALSVGELGASVLVVPPGRTTLSVRFFTLIHFGLYADAAGACLLLIAVTAAAGLLAGLLLRTLAVRRSGGPSSL